MRTDQQSLDGFFWVPGHSERKLSGRLTIKDGGCVHLDVVGCFDSDLSQWNTSVTVPRIVGMLEGDTPTTLDRCVYSRKQFPILEVPKSRLHVGIAFIGLGYDSGEQVGFESFEFSVEGLDQWHERTGIRVASSKPPFAISYASPDPVPLWESDDLALSLVFSCDGPSIPAFTSVSISQTSKFRLTGNGPLSFDQFAEVAHKVVHLLCLATGKTVSIFNVVARTPTQTLADGSRLQFSPEVYFESRSFTEAAPQIDRWDLMFHLDQLPGGPQICFNRWMSVYSKATPAMNLFFSDRAGKYSVLSGRFLSLAQSLETFHRRTCDTVRMTKEDYDRMIDTLQQACPPEYRAFLNARLMHANEPTQRDRLAELLAPFANHFGDHEEQQRLLKWIVDTRNYFTHYAEGGKTKAARGRMLWVLCGKMEVLLQLCLLRDIGFSALEIDGIIERTYWLKNPLKRPWAD